MLSNPIVQLAEHQSSSEYQQGNSKEQELVALCFKSILNPRTHTLETNCTEARVLYFILRYDHYLSSALTSYFEAVHYHELNWAGKPSPKYESYAYGDSLTLAPVGKNAVRVQLSTRFSKRYTIKEVSQAFSNLLKANLLVRVENKFLINFPYIIRAITQFGYSDAYSNFTKK